MSIRETTETVPSSPSGVQGRFRRWLVRRCRQFQFVALVLAGLVLVGACGVMVRRATSLIGLPDVGDPFDIAAFRALKVPDDRNAFVMFRQATDKFRPTPSLSEAVRRAGPMIAWSQADPKLHEWVASNRQALSLFRAATLRPDIAAASLGGLNRTGFASLNLGRFVWLAMLDSSRLEEQGDMSAAWDDYRAILRMRGLVMQRGTVLDRYFANQNSQGLGSRITAWAANPKTDVTLIRRALDDVCALEPKPEWDAFSLKLEYLQMMGILDRTGGGVLEGPDGDPPMFLGIVPLPPNLAVGFYAARRFLVNEPECSRRLLRLAFANWLAHVHDQDPARRKPSVRAIFSLQTVPTSLSFFSPGPGAPASAHALSPHELATRTMIARDAARLAAPVALARDSDQRKTGASRPGRLARRGTLSS